MSRASRKIRRLEEDLAAAVDAAEAATVIADEAVAALARHRDRAAGDIVARAIPVRLAHQLEVAELQRDQWHAAYHLIEARCADLTRALLQVRR
ncbi:hypothetical protein [Iamia sp.]|uniref:hypothetical protein n=1 Tax=Iamia sp. TaxID=2722710 RepID=UPI002B7A4E74|nr:hypothetical protein [Iamia sp.]HXH58443.1 hypothetical protein [Iamia sp.]